MEMSFIAALASKFAIKTGICGIGPAASAFGVTRLINECSTDIVVLAGIGGVYEPDALKTLKIGSAVFAKKEVFGDLGRCSQDGIEPIIIDGQELAREYDLSENLPPFVNKAIANSGNLVDMVTVCCASGSLERGRLMHRLHGAFVENMEGASCAMVCKHYNLPFIEVRGISNVAGDIDKNNWRIAEAMEGVLALTDSFLASLLQNK